MSRPLLILRPEPGAGATAARARALGRETIVAPLFRIGPIGWEPPPPAGFDAVMLTSANAVRHGGAALSLYRHLPVHAVGAATAEAARRAGFSEVTAHDGDAALLLAALRGRVRRLLHLAGRDHRAIEEEGILVERRIVYAANVDDGAETAIGQALRRGPVILLHSARAAGVVAELADRSGIDRSRIRLAAISPAALAAAGEGWGASEAAAAPRDDALLAVAARLCD